MNITLQNAVEHVNPKLKHVLEFGVYRGKTLKQLRDSFDETFQVYGFDSFQGLPEDWTGPSCKAGSMSTNGKIPDIPGTRIFPGWFVDSIPEYLPEAKPIALLHIDCDLYSSTMDILNNLLPYIVQDTVIVFDEWVYNHKDIPANREHEQRAWLEFSEKHSIRYELIPRINTHAEMERQIILITDVNA